MGTEEPKGFKEIDWKNIGETVQNEPSVEPVVKKRLPKKVRQIPDYYFLPRRSIPSAIAFYGAWIVAGVGAGMLAEIWINKKVKGLAKIINFWALELAFINMTNRADICVIAFGAHQDSIPEESPPDSRGVIMREHSELPKAVVMKESSTLKNVAHYE
ncbi:hypothetical protein RJ639_043285 [Escallonia herrerae]|uniref:Uncharacterized protein n=1 Tax=Escallonia herrerae TaxID=1293975 RepID=A0AA88WB60_9ASTE|nr:hypothetical protein RJ639_043285 [Escallonia herrerae]